MPNRLRRGLTSLRSFGPVMACGEWFRQHGVVGIRKVTAMHGQRASRQELKALRSLERCPTVTERCLAVIGVADEGFDVGQKRWMGQLTQVNCPDPRWAPNGALESTKEVKT
ncbi:hypothetical protein [Rhodoferax sp.]|uniref:hypothetical protein n=1 Tax=Rhodoferax sp. TaxID=50421 RepID=UPI00275C5BDC|nr:hypothetical protein [Rhodoferax sp.]